MTSNPDSSRKLQYIAGLDTLRVFALVLITWQHAASVWGAYAQTQWRLISPGQTGVAIFCVISGYLAFQTRPTDTEAWLRKRLQTIFPSYWIVTVIAFALALAFGSNKPISLGLFVSQLLGLGFFTHGWELVNVVSWFISLILLCYLLSYAIHKLGMPLISWVLVALVASLLVASRTEVDLSRHVLGFALGATYALGRKSLLLPAIGAALAIIGCLYDPLFFYSGFGLFVVALAMRVLRKDPAVFRQAAFHSYEYFLIHGIFLVAAAKFISPPGLSISIAIVSAMVGAIGLKLGENYFMNTLYRSRALNNENGPISSREKT